MPSSASCDPTFFQLVDTYQSSLSGTPVYSVDYTRDSLGRIIRKEEQVLGESTVEEFTYDSSAALYTYTKDGVAKSFSYDENGNRLPGVYDEQDRLLSEGDNTYAYNLNGDTESITNTATGDVTRFSYDEFGNLQSVVLPGGDRIDYLADGKNRRRVKKKNGEKVYSLLYKDQLNPVALLDKDDIILMQFVYGSKGHVPDYMIAGGEKYRILSDHLGSVRLVIRMNTGEVVQRLDYGPWGEVVQDTNPGFQPFGFAGGLYDHETSLVRFGARDYNPKTGRWMQKDPIGFAGGDVNLYRYAGNDPVNRIDPAGKSFTEDLSRTVVCACVNELGCTQEAVECAAKDSDLNTQAEALYECLGKTFGSDNNTGTKKEHGGK